MGSTTTAKPTPGIRAPTAGTVIILSRLQMMSQTVATALRARGLDAEQMAWAEGVRRATHDLTPSDAVLLLDNQDDLDFGLATVYLVAQSPARFLVLTAQPEGPVWGGLLASGVAAVMPTESSLDEVAQALALVARGESPMSEARRADLVRLWVNWLAGDEAGDRAGDREPEAAGVPGGVRPIAPREPSTLER